MTWNTGSGCDWGSGGGDTAVAQNWDIGNNKSMDLGFNGGASFDNDNANANANANSFDNGYGDTDGGAGGDDRACFNCGEAGYVEPNMSM
ncbi:hypothetical protein VP1G_11292 [Cytospora mali]|uniref:Uncharacterized protein n=1 Tax=Cytospora mali TaxID=578113 RepID=A0A194VCM7_CYTMA|nr:hypothetical protein VP1G_11292 [Valsa mali var. pyri (nom. inval.)]